ncbi:hypothetical protein CC80DRAFT_598726 [Byssothecium circinans]|uniref:Uncharacterized protein n=1 Tax=Byssothecium circinans TaxID=147558 RepID=A0A6A5TAJ4_9PLEO|nr:hypothetical protein CC80DRAFT_598726 [Byssothecium circinans]
MAHEQTGNEEAQQQEQPSPTMDCVLSRVSSSGSLYEYSDDRLPSRSSPTPIATDTLVDIAPEIPINDDIELPPSPPLVLSGERLLFENRLNDTHETLKYEFTKQQHRLGEQENSLMEELEKREACLKTAIETQQSQTDQEYFLPLPWSKPYETQLVYHPDIEFRYRALEARIDNNIRARIDWLRSTLIPDDPSYPQIARELELLLEWGERRGLLTLREQIEQGTVRNEVEALEMRVREALKTVYQTPGSNMALFEQGVQPISHELPEMIRQLVYWWPGLRRRWERLEARERRNFPNRFEEGGEGRGSGSQLPWMQNTYWSGAEQESGRAVQRDDVEEVPDLMEGVEEVEEVEEVHVEDDFKPLPNPDSWW